MSATLSRARAPRARRSSPAALPAEPAGSRSGSAAPAGVYGQIFPPGVDERAAVHGLPPALQIGRIDIPPAHEDEFNEWYNTEYLIGNMTVNGVYSARRYLNRGPGPRYLTVYEFAHPEVSRQPAWDRARAQSVWRRRIERFWAHAPGSPGHLPPPGRALTRAKPRGRSSP